MNIMNITIIDIPDLTLGNVTDGLAAHLHEFAKVVADDCDAPKAPPASAMNRGAVVGRQIVNEAAASGGVISIALVMALVADQVGQALADERAREVEAGIIAVRDFHGWLAGHGHEHAGTPIHMIAPETLARLVAAWAQELK